MSVTIITQTLFVCSHCCQTGGLKIQWLLPPKLASSRPTSPHFFLTKLEDWSIDNETSYVLSTHANTMANCLQPHLSKHLLRVWVPPKSHPVFSWDACLTFARLPTYVSLQDTSAPMVLSSMSHYQIVALPKLLLYIKKHTAWVKHSLPSTPGRLTPMPYVPLQGLPKWPGYPYCPKFLSQ
jgi:hypothetical protein